MNAKDNLTARQRAEDIQRTLSPFVILTGTMVDFIEEHIEEAEREARKIGEGIGMSTAITVQTGQDVNFLTEGKLLGFKAGFKAAQEKAAKIAENEPINILRSQSHEGLRLSISERIRAMGPSK